MPAAPQESFGQLNFAHAQLKDKRRTKRLVSLADSIHRHPGGTLPDKIKSPGWLILWRGWTTLQAMLEDVEVIKRCG